MRFRQDLGRKVDDRRGRLGRARSLRHRSTPALDEQSKDVKNSRTVPSDCRSIMYWLSNPSSTGAVENGDILASQTGWLGAFSAETGVQLEVQIWSFADQNFCANFQGHRGQLGGAVHFSRVCCSARMHEDDARWPTVHTTGADRNCTLVCKTRGSAAR